MAKKGIDVSYANSFIDWCQVKQSEIDFAILRSTFGSESPSQVDNQYKNNADGCVRYGIPFGIYHFAYFIDEKTARDEADFAIKKANEYRDYVKFIALDVEEDSERYAKSIGANPNWTNCAIAFLEKVKAAGYTPVIYTNQSWMNYQYDWSRLSKYKLWYAAPGAISPKYDCSIWQYSWNGQVNGMTGAVDMDYLYDDDLLFSTNTKTDTNVKDSNNNANNNTNYDINDIEKFLKQAGTYVGQTGYGVCIEKLKLGFIVDWCAFAVSSIMNDCGFIGKYIKAIEGGAGTIPRYSDGIYGEWFKKGSKAPQAGDLFFMRYADYPSQDKYFCDHVGIVEKVEGNAIITLEGNVDGISGNWAETSTFKRKTRYLSDYTVYAFYRPYWNNNKSTSNDKQKDNQPIDNKPTENNTNDITNVSQISSSKIVDFKVKIASTDGVNIRNGASTTYKILGAISYDTTVNITRQTSGGGYTWGLTNYNGITGWIALDYTTKVSDSIVLNVGDKVKVKQGAVVYGTNQSLGNFVYNTKFTVMEVSGSRIVIGINGIITTAIDKKYLTKV